MCEMKVPAGVEESVTVACPSQSAPNDFLYRYRASISAPLSGNEAHQQLQKRPTPEPFLMIICFEHPDLDDTLLLRFPWANQPAPIADKPRRYISN
jgi:hypothetical protein